MIRFYRIILDPNPGLSNPNDMHTLISTLTLTIRDIKNPLISATLIERNIFGSIWCISKISLFSVK